jgi:hypothetical protein
VRHRGVFKERNEKHLVTLLCVLFLVAFLFPVTSCERVNGRDFPPDWHALAQDYICFFPASKAEHKIRNACKVKSTGL